MFTVKNHLNITFPIEDFRISSAINFDNFIFDLKINSNNSNLSQLEKGTTNNLFQLVFYLEKIQKNEKDMSYNLISNIVFNFKIANLFYPIPLFIYEFQFLCKIFEIYEDTQLFLLNQSSCKDFLIDFGNVKVKDRRKYLISIENLNAEDIEIKSLKIGNLNKISYEQEFFLTSNEYKDTLYTTPEDKYLNINNNNNFLLPTKESLMIIFSLCSLTEEKKNGYIEFVADEVKK